VGLLEHPDFQRKLTRPQFKKRVEEILRLLKTEVRPFEDLSEAAARARRERGRADIFNFARTYLPHYFYCEAADFHLEADALINAPAEPGELKPPIVIAAPRDHAKSTSITLLQSLQRAVYGRNHFTILGSDTKDLAADFNAYLFLEMVENERLTADFGQLLDPNQSVYDFVTGTGVRILARGSGQRLRGVKHGPHRPDLFILDDMENDQNVKNPRLVEARLRWVTEAVLPAIAADGALVWVGTILARRSALGQVIHSQKEPYKHWTRRCYRAIDPEGRALWPARWPVNQLLAKKRQVGTVAFNKEYQNNPQDEESPFREEWFRYYSRADLELVRRRLLIASGTDPSSTAQGDNKGHTVVGLDPLTMVIYLLRTWGKKLSPSGLLDALYLSHRHHGWVAGGIEDNALKDWLKEAVDQAAKRHGRRLPLREVHNSANKEARIVGTLSPLVEAGHILLPEDDPEAEALKEELLYILDGSTPDDQADSAEIAVRIVQSLPKGAAGYQPVDKRTDWHGRTDDDGAESGFIRELTAVRGVF